MTIGKAIYEFDSLTSKSTEVVHKHERVSAKALGLAESWFRDAIFRDPELVIAPCREGGLVQESEKWMSLDWEYPIPGAGRVDVMLMSSFGRLGLVETKLSSNPEGRREVVAQLLEYSLSLRSLDSSIFEGALPFANGAQSYEDFREKFIAGDFLLIVAADNLDPRAVRLADGLLGKHLTSGWDLAMVEINLFRSESKPESVIIVPTLCRTIMAEKRQVVTVVVEDNRKGTTVTVDWPTPTVESGRRQDMESDTSFMSELHAQHPERANTVERILAKLHDIETANPDAFEYGLRSSSANLYWRTADGKARIIAINRRGQLRVWLDYLIKSGNESIANEIRALAAPVLGVTSGEFATSASIFVDDNNVNALLALVSDIARTVQTMGQ